MDGSSQIAKVDPHEQHHGDAAAASFIPTSPEEQAGHNHRGASMRSYSQFTSSSTSTMRTPRLPPEVTNIRDAKLAIALGRTAAERGGEARGGRDEQDQQQQEPVEPSMLMEDLQRTTMGGEGPGKVHGSSVTAITATSSSSSSWSQLPVALPIDVSAIESSMSLLPNSGVVPIRASQIHRGEISSIRDNLVLRASARSSSDVTSGVVKNSLGQVNDTSTTLTESSSSGVASSTMQPMPPRQMLETTNELEAYDDGEQSGRSSSNRHFKEKEDPPACGTSKTKLAVVFAVVLVVLVIAAVAGVCLLGKQCGGGGGDSNNNGGSENTDEDRSTRISRFINSITLSPAPLDYPVTMDTRAATNPERALAWLLQDDPLQLQGFDHELLQVRQRFVLLSIWFGASATNTWKSTGNWLSGAHECDWVNVLCSNGSSGERIIQDLKLGNGGIVGTIPDDLALLSDSLQHFTLAYNTMTGSIPSTLGLLTKLVTFDVESNSLSGTIPSSLSSLSLLQAFFVGKNKLAGTIPPELGQWTSATSLSIFNNPISGQVPSELGNMSLLKYFSIQNTMIGGSLPKSLLTWVDALEILVFNTNLNGSMPLCDQDDLKVFRLVADCGEVNCTCCTACCPKSFGATPLHNAC